MSQPDRTLHSLNSSNINMTFAAYILSFIAKQDYFSPGRFSLVDKNTSCSKIHCFRMQHVSQCMKINKVSVLCNKLIKRSLINKVELSQKVEQIRLNVRLRLLFLSSNTINITRRK
jgi:hypothetical protein